jgi:hypothetical protein
MEDVERALALADLDRELLAGLGVRDRNEDSTVVLAPQ